MIEFLPHYNQTRFMAYVPKIRKQLDEWHLVEVSLTGKTNHNGPQIAKKLKEYFGDREGIIFLCSPREMLAVVNMGKATDVHTLADGINSKLPEYSCSVGATDITADGLLKFQIRLEEMEEAGVDTSKSALFEARLNRPGRVIMAVDDDLFMRSLITKTFSPKGKVVEMDKAENVVETYLEVLPDIVFLDIHLPGGSGIDVLTEILSFDETAYIVILSSDSVKDNVLTSQKIGAKGFVVKPFTSKKLEDFYNKCPTIPGVAAAKS